MQKIYPLKKKLILFFGEEVYQNNKLNTKFLSKKVFENSFYLKYLTKLIHPLVFLDFKFFFLFSQWGHVPPLPPIKSTTIISI